MLISTIFPFLLFFKEIRSLHAQSMSSPKAVVSSTRSLASILPSNLVFKSSVVSSSTIPSSTNIKPPIYSTATKSIDSNKKVHVLSQVILPGNKPLHLETLSSINNKVNDILIKEKSIETNYKISVNCGSAQSINLKPPEIIANECTLNRLVPTATSPNLSRKKVSSSINSEIEATHDKSVDNSLLKRSSSEEESDFFGFSSDLSHERISALEKLLKGQSNLYRKDSPAMKKTPAPTSTRIMMNNQEISHKSTSNVDKSNETESMHDTTPSSESEEETVENLVRQAGEILKEEYGVDVESPSLQSPNKSASSIEKETLIDDFLDATKSGFQVELEDSSSDSSHEKLNAGSPPLKKTKEMELTDTFLSAKPPPKRNIPNISQLKPVMEMAKSPRKPTQTGGKQKKLTEFFKKSPTVSNTSTAENPNDLKSHANRSPKRPAESDSVPIKRRRSVLNYNDLLNSNKIGKNRAETLSKISKYVSENIVKIDDIDVGLNEAEILSTSTPLIKGKKGRSDHTSISESESNAETVANDVQIDNSSIEQLPAHDLNESLPNEIAEVKKAGRRGRKPKNQTESIIY